MNDKLCQIIEKQLSEKVTVKNLVKLIQSKYNPHIEEYKHIFILFNIETMNLEAYSLCETRELNGKFVIIMVFSDLVDEGLNRNDFTFRQFLKASYNKDIMMNYIRENF